MVEYLDYEGWLALYYALGKDGARVRSAIVLKLVILYTHLHKPIPPTATNLHASIESIYDLKLIVPLPRKVPGETKGIVILDRWPSNKQWPSRAN